MIRIESPDNKTYKMLKSLLNSKGIKKEEMTLVMGDALTKELKPKYKNSKTIHFDESKDPDYLLSKKLFDKLSILNSDSPILLLPFEHPKKYKPLKKSFDVFLPVGDPKNLGALIRTSLAFDVDRIVLLEESAHPFLPETVRSSSGTVFSAPLYKGPSLNSLDVDDLWTLDKGGENIFDWHPENLNSIKVLLGEEGGGLLKEQLTNSISIPISDKVESLNVNSALSCTLMWIKSLKSLNR